VARRSSSRAGSTGSPIIARTWVWILLAIVALASSSSSSRASGPFVNETDRWHPHDPRHRPAPARLGFIGFVLWDWRNQEWLITTRRVIRAEGVLNKSVSDSSLEKINDARLDQSIFGRIFGFGTLDILTAAEELGGERGRLPDARRPDRRSRRRCSTRRRCSSTPTSRRRATSARRAAEAPAARRADAAAGGLRPRRGPRLRGSPRRACPPRPRASAPAGRGRARAADELAVTLERLAGLRDKGLITPEEYEGKKRDLLERM
jgi:hypothetical protein